MGELYVDPNLISNMTNSHVEVQSLESLQNTQGRDPAFLVIQPSSETCDQQGTLDFRKIEKDVKDCIDLAVKARSAHPNTEVFISSLPPRYDTEVTSRSTDLWNSILTAETFIHERVHVVQQSGLECDDKKGRRQRYQQGGFLLTPYGTRLLSKNIGTSIMKVATRDIMSNTLMPSRKPVKKPNIKLSTKQKQYVITKVLNGILV